MVPATRRRLLLGAAGLAAGLAGCSGSNSSSVSRSNDPSDAENVETEPEAFALRNAEDAPVAWFADDGTGTPETDREAAIHERESGLIDGPERAAQLRFADVPAANDARSFVENRDFDRETALLQTRKVAECYRLELCAVTWSADSYHTYFGRRLRPADVACSAEDEARVAHLIRIPAVLDREDIRSRGSGSTSRSCATYDRRFERREGGR